MSCQIYLILFLAFMLKELLSVSIVLKSIKEKLNMSHHHYFFVTQINFRPPSDGGLMIPPRTLSDVS